MPTDVLEIIIRVVDKATAGIKKTKEGVDNLTKSTNKLGSAANASKNALLGFGLSALFSGMALSRATGAALNSILNVSKIAGSEMTAFNVQTQRLIANWEFFKYTFLDALGQNELFMTFVDFLIQLVNWFAELNPEKKVIAIGALAGAFTIGKISSFVGQVGLAVLGFKAMKELGLLPFFTKLGVFLLTVAAGFIIISFGFALIKNKWESDAPILEKIIFSLGIALLALGAIALILGSAIALPLIVFGLALTALALSIDRWGADAILNFKIIFNEIARIIQSVILVILEAWNTMIDTIVTRTKEFYAFLPKKVRNFVFGAVQFAGEVAKIDTGFMHDRIAAIDRATMGLLDELDTIRAERETGGTITENIKQGIKDGLVEMGETISESFSEVIGESVKQGTLEGTKEGTTEAWDDFVARGGLDTVPAE